MTSIYEILNKKLKIQMCQLCWHPALRDDCEVIKFLNFELKALI